MASLLGLLSSLLVIGLLLLPAFSEASVIAREDAKEAKIRASREVDLGVGTINLQVGGIVDPSARRRR
ncbi:hypothetical protein AAVH_31995 [Aphelenchoides avenae]|nr:hypothetical protein AAVH_31995 [Aphelenchus avenae]